MLHKIFSDEMTIDIENMVIKCELKYDEREIIKESIKKYKEIEEEIRKNKTKTNKRRIRRILKYMGERIYEMDIYNDEYKAYEYIEENKIKKEKEKQMDIYIYIYRYLLIKSLIELKKKGYEIHGYSICDMIINSIKCYEDEIK